MRRLIAPALIALLGLAACQPRGADGQRARSPDDPPPAPAPPIAVRDYSGDIDAHGSDPAWSLRIRGGTLTLSQAGKPEIVAPVAAPTVGGGQAAWTARTAEGQQLTATVFVSDCQDPASATIYPLAAQVLLTDRTQLSGCAAKAAGAPKRQP
jgi:uncharacterized membrane protein